MIEFLVDLKIWNYDRQHNGHYAGVHVCFTQLTLNGLAIFSDPENMSRPLFYGKSVAK